MGETITYPGGEKVRYSHYAGGRIKSVTDSSGRVTYYEYDATGNVTKTTRPDGSVETCSYYALGQLTDQTDTAADGSIISRRHYEYDVKGNIIKTTEEGRKGTTDGEVTGSNTLELGIMPTGFSGVSAESKTVSGIIDTASGDNSADLTAFGENQVTTLSMEYDEANRLISFNGQKVKYDRDGNILAEYTYGTYGELLSGDKNHIQYLYNGKFGVITDSNNLYQMRARYYNVNTKRFINQDVVRGSISNSQSLNRYCYVQGNPITLTDPFGLSALPLLGDTVGAGLALSIGDIYFGI